MADALKEMQQIFNLSDANQDGVSVFEEFVDFYSLHILRYSEYWAREQDLSDDLRKRRQCKDG